MTRLTSSKWFLPAFCILLGVAFLVAQWLGGNVVQGAYAVAFMAALALALLLGARSETV